MDNRTMLSQRQWGGTASPADVGMQVHQQQSDSPLVTARKEYAPTGQVTLAPGAELHTTQNYLNPRAVNSYRAGPGGQMAADGEVSVTKDAQGRTWVENGHHRLAADRLEGRKTKATLYETMPGLTGSS